MELLIIFALVLLNGVFAMSEMALVSSKKFKLENARKRKVRGAKTALELSEDPTRFLSTVQIGITVIGILLGLYSGEKIASDVAAYLSNYDFLKPYADKLSVGILVIFITYLSIVLGELFPKRVGMTFPEPIAMIMARPMKILSRITAPFVWLLSVSNDLLSKITGLKNRSNSFVSEEEIKSIIKESTDSGEIREIEHNLVERVFEMGDKKVDELFTYRSEIVYLNENISWGEIEELVKTELHSAYPVVKDDDIDEIIGIVLVKDLFVASLGRTGKPTDMMRKPLFFVENTNAYKVLESFKKEKLQHGIVVDEYGQVKGLVTLNDLLHALVGDVNMEADADYSIRELNPNQWMVDGQYSLAEFSKKFDLILGEDVRSQYITVSGLLIHALGQLPKEGDRVEIDGFSLEVMDMDAQRVDKIMVQKLSQ